MAEVDGWKHTPATMKTVHSDFCKKFGLSISESTATDACSPLVKLFVCTRTILLTDLPVNQVVFIVGAAVIGVLEFFIVMIVVFCLLLLYMFIIAITCCMHCATQD